MTRLRTIIDQALSWVLIALMGFAVLNVLWQVFTRWVLDDPSSYTEELARYLLIWIGLLGSALAVGKKLHLAIDLVPSKLEGARRDVLEIVIESTVLLFALAVMVIGGARLVGLTFEFQQVSAALGVPLGYVYAVIPLSGGLIVFYALVSIIERTHSLRGEGGADAAPSRSTTKPID